MDTYFAPATRAPQAQLLAEIETVNESAVLNGLLRSIGGLPALLDEYRQTVGVNDALLDLPGSDDPPAALGLRLGRRPLAHMPKAPPPGAAPPRPVPPAGPSLPSSPAWIQTSRWSASVP